MHVLGLQEPKYCKDCSFAQVLFATGGPRALPSIDSAARAPRLPFAIPLRLYLKAR